jgi:chromosome segregation ATPase
MSHTCPTIENQKAIETLKESFDTSLAHQCLSFDVARTAAAASNDAVKCACDDLKAIEESLEAHQAELTALQEKATQIGTQIEAVDKRIEEKADELNAIQTEYDEATKTSTTAFSQPGRSIAEAKAEFDQHYEEKIRPLSGKLDEARRNLQSEEMMKVLHTNEQLDCQSKICAKQTEIADQHKAIQTQLGKIATAKAQFVIKLAQLKACSNLLNFSEELRVKNEEIARLKHEIEAVNAQKQQQPPA